MQRMPRGLKIARCERMCKSSYGLRKPPPMLPTCANDVCSTLQREIATLRHQLEQSQQLEQGCAEKLSSALNRTRLHSQ